MQTAVVAEDRATYTTQEAEPFRREGLGYVYEPPGAGVRLSVDYLHRRSDDLTGEILVESMMPGVPSHLHQARFTLTSTTTRISLAKHLGELTQGVVGWLPLLEQFCVGVLRREREGEPFTRVGRLPATLTRPDIIETLLQSGRITLLYGPGGVGKGWLATFAAVCVTTGTPFAGLAVQQGPVLYLDWEDDEETLDRRVKWASAGLDLTTTPEIHYRRCGGPLPEMVHRVARYVTEQRISLIILDSVELGCGTANENVPYQARAEGYFKAIRSIQTIATPGATPTVLCIDHVSGEAARNETTVNKAYGSVFKGYWARNSWEMRKDQEAGANAFHVGLYHFKPNHTKLFAPIGFTFDFADPGMVYLAPHDVGASASLSKRLPLADQIAGVLMQERPLEAKDIAERLGMTGKTGQVRVELHRHKPPQGKRFIQTTDGRWTFNEERREGPQQEPLVRLVQRESIDEIPF